MTRAIYFILFVSLALAVYAGLHFFIYWRTSSGFDWPTTQKWILKIGLILASLTFPLGEFLSRFTWSVPFVYTGFIWLGILTYAFSFFFFEWLAGLLFPGIRRWAVPAVWVAVFALALISWLRELPLPVVKEIIVPVRRLSRDHEGFTIIQLSDLHIGFHTPVSRIQGMVKMVNDLNPDLVVITGDLVDRDICRHDRFCEPLARFKARHGVYAVTGNHEFYAGLERFRELAERSGIHVLQNRAEVIANIFTLVGLDDDQGRDFGQEGPNLEKAMTGAVPDLPLILLYHRPTRFLEARQRGVSLQLSGHTHAGQIPPADLAVQWIYRYPFGQYLEGESTIYTTCGTGTWGPPMRLFSRSEIVRITLISVPLPGKNQ